MRFHFIAATLLAASSVSIGSETQSPMTAGDVTCPKYLAMADSASEKEQLQSWVAGRVAAIIPSSFQRELRKISIQQFRSDLNEVCSRSDPEFTLFDVSAMLAHGYQEDHRP